MAVNYKLHQNHEKNNVKAYGKWYARACHTETVDIWQLAETMQANCTVKRSDILAVLSELADAMTTELHNGNKVFIRGLGTFSLRLSSNGVDHPDDFQPERDVRQIRIHFRPETHVLSDGRRRRALVDGATARELPRYRVKGAAQP